MKRLKFTAVLLLLTSCAIHGQQQPEVMVQFELDTGRPVVQAYVNGQGPYPFVFDTGAPGLIIRKHLSDKLSLEVVDQKKVGSPAGGTPISADIVRVDQVSLGGAQVEAINATVIDFGGPDLGGGIIGPAVFKEFGRLAMDFEKNTIEIGGEIKNQNTHWTRFGQSAPLLDMTLVIEGVEIAAHLDTGAPHIISVPKQFADQLPLAGPVKTVAKGRTIDREFEILGAPIDSMAKLGGATIPLTQLQFFDLPFANIGTGALRGLYLEIDWVADRFYLEGEAKPVTLKPKRRRVMRSTSATPGKVDLSWLSGCWEDKNGNKEVWSTLEGDLMFGYGVTTQDGATVFFEQLRIEEQQDKTTYLAYPRGGSPTSFTLTESTESVAEFANPNHDYPQLIRYERKGDQLIATISLLDKSEPKRFSKTRCSHSS